MSRITGDRMMVVGAAPDRTLADLHELRQGSRYFAWANFWRGIAYVPPAIVLVQVSAWFGFGLLAFLIVFHFLCWQLEFYRTAMAEELERREQVLAEAPLAESEAIGLQPHWFYSPKNWESEKLYERIGFSRIGDWVVAYTTKTKLTPVERQSGGKAKFVGGKTQNLEQFERDTRTGEMLHLTAGALNIPPLLEFALRGMPLWAGYLVLVLILDVCMALLQRYHRVRVTRLLSRSRRRR